MFSVHHFTTLSYNWALQMCEANLQCSSITTNGALQEGSPIIISFPEHSASRLHLSSVCKAQFILKGPAVVVHNRTISISHDDDTTAVVFFG